MNRFMNGDERTTTWGKRFRDWGEAAGTSYGSRYGPYGATLGGLAGRGIGAGLSRITGNGDYVVGNSLLPGMSTGNVSFGNGSIRVTHREFIQDIVSSTTFSIQGLEINPGLARSFPFLSQLAQNFEVYQMHGLVFEYRPTCGDAIASTNNAMGVVVQCVQYNSTNLLFQTKQQMEAYEGAVSCAPYNGSLCGVECEPGSLPLRRLYIRSSGIPAGQDEKMYDMGDYSIATVGQQNVNTIGELWVSYDITLSLPKLFGALGYNIDWSHFRASTGITQSAPFGNVDVELNVNFETTLISSASGTVVTFQPEMLPGTYNLTYIVYGASTAALSSPVFTFTPGFTNLNCLNNAARSTIQNVSGNTSTYQFVTQYITYNGGDAAPAATLTQLTGFMGTPTVMELIINMISPSFL